MPNPTVLTDVNFEQEVTRHDGDMVVLCTAKRSPESQLMLPVLEALAERNPLMKVATLDIGDHPKTGSQLKVQEVPLIVRYVRGREVGRVSGAFTSPRALERALQI